jgi:preprotein translocase subunit SecB
MNQNPESGYKFVNIFLMQSDFKREMIVTSEPDKLKQELEIKPSFVINEEVITVTESLSFKHMYDGITQVEANIVMIGVFEKFGDSKLSSEEFGSINGPAIIFPFIREQFSNLTSKAGLGLMLLQPVNFEKIKS